MAVGTTDPLGLGGYNVQALHYPTTTTPAVKGSGSLLGRIAKGFIQAPSYFAKTDIINPIKQEAAMTTGNKVALANVNKDEAKTIGATPTQAFKRLAGNTAQLAATVAAPEAKAGLTAKAVQGAKIGTVAGGGSALANDDNVLKGAAEGAAGGAILAPIASKLFPGKAATAIEETPATKVSNTLKANLNNHAQQLDAGAGGFNAGAKLPGAPQAGINLAKSRDISSLMDKYNIPAGSPATKLKYIQDQLNGAKDDLNGKIESNNIPITDEDKQAIANEFHTKISEQPNATALMPHATALSKHFLGNDTPPVMINGQELDPATAAGLGIKTPSTSNVTDLKGLNGYKQKLDNLINYDKGSQSVDTNAEQAHTLMRQTLSDQIGKYAPEVKGANQTYSELKDIETPTLMENNKLHSTEGGLYNRLFNNGVVKGAESKAANLVMKTTGGVPNKAAPAIASEAPVASTQASGIISKLRGAPVTSDVAKKVATVGVPGALGNNAPGSAATTAMSPDVQAQFDAAEAASKPSATSDDTTDTSDASSFSKTDLINAINSDPKNASTYISLYNAIKPPATSTKSSLSTTQQKEVDAGTAAIANLKQYAGQINDLTKGSNGNVAAGKLSVLLGKYDPVASSSQKNAAALDSQKRDVTYQLAQAISGGNKPTTSTLESIEAGLPSVSDSPQLRDSKINNLIDRLQTTLKIYSTPTDQLVTQNGL